MTEAKKINQEYAYIGDCAAGEVVFKVESKPVVMPYEELVTVPESLAAKLANNQEFVDAEGLKKRQAAKDAAKKSKAAKTTADTVKTEGGK